MDKVSDNNCRYDIIIVGAGNGGLSAASFAVQKGFRTIVFEKHNLPGGAVTSFRRGRFEFEPSIHEICGIGSEEKPGETRRLFKEMKSDAHFVYEPSLYRAICVSPREQFDVKLPAGIDELCKKIEEIDSGSGEKVKKFFEYSSQCMQTINKLTKEGFKWKDRGEVLNCFRMFAFSSDIVMDLMRIPKKIQHMITPYWTYVGEPTSTLNAFMMGMMDSSYARDGAGVPTMFSHELSCSLDKVIRENGGTIYYNTPVTKILVKNKKAYGVEAGGKTYYADRIICNCFPNDVFGHLVERKRAPKREIRKINARRLGLSFVNVHLGLNKSAEELGVKDYTTFILKEADSLSQWKKSHGLGGDGLIIANNLNVIIPGCSPEGTSHMSLTACVFGSDWARIRPEDYKKTKLKVADRMISSYEEATGIKIRPYIEEIEVATPVTYSRYLGTPNGTPYGYQTSNWDGIVTRTIFKKKEKTIKGLYFAGATTETSLGVNMTYLSGKNVMEEILHEEA